MDATEARRREGSPAAREEEGEKFGPLDGLECWMTDFAFIWPNDSILFLFFFERERN